MPFNNRAKVLFKGNLRNYSASFSFHIQYTIHVHIKRKLLGDNSFVLYIHTLWSKDAHVNQPWLIRILSLLVDSDWFRNGHVSQAQPIIASPVHYF